ncbi:MAG: CopG family transcriptional regulator [Flavobacteriales bacterium]|nr:CopG family transcriptional regulator [Flavobacteriales bacterium]
MSTKRVQVSFTEKQWELLEKFKGELGESDADIVRSIVISWLSEKSFISSTIKKRNNLNNNDESK